MSSQTEKAIKAPTNVSAKRSTAISIVGSNYRLSKLKFKDQEDTTERRTFKNAAIEKQETSNSEKSKSQKCKESDQDNTESPNIKTDKKLDYRNEEIEGDELKKSSKSFRNEEDTKTIDNAYHKVSEDKSNESDKKDKGKITVDAVSSKKSDEEIKVENADEKEEKQEHATDKDMKTDNIKDREAKHGSAKEKQNLQEGSEERDVKKDNSKAKNGRKDAAKGKELKSTLTENGVEEKSTQDAKPKTRDISPRESKNISNLQNKIKATENMNKMQVTTETSIIEARQTNEKAEQIVPEHTDSQKSEKLSPKLIFKETKENIVYNFEPLISEDHKDVIMKNTTSNPASAKLAAISTRRKQINFSLRIRGRRSIRPIRGGNLQASYDESYRKDDTGFETTVSSLNATHGSDTVNDSNLSFVNSGVKRTQSDTVVEYCNNQDEVEGRKLKRPRLDLRNIVSIITSPMSKLYERLATRNQYNAVGNEADTGKCATIENVSGTEGAEVMEISHEREEESNESFKGIVTKNDDLSSIKNRNDSDGRKNIFEAKPGETQIIASFGVNKRKYCNVM